MSAHYPLFFPVFIPEGFVPSDSDGDGVDLNARKKDCPGYKPPYKPSSGGGFTAPRGPKKLRHRAWDIMAAEGAEVRSPRPGVVPERVPNKGMIVPGAGVSPKGGNYCYVDFDDGFRGYFAHMRDEVLVTPGQTVEANDLLGYVGRTGNAVRADKKTGLKTGCPHLHISLRNPVGVPVDLVPMYLPLLNAGRWRSAP